MRQLQYLGVFRRDLKKLVRSGRYRLNEIDDVVESLRRDQPLAKRYHDHALSGNWKDHRECHIIAVWVVMYRRDPYLLVLGCTGSHSESFCKRAHKAPCSIASNLF